MGFDPSEARGKDGRWSRMNSTAKAKLTASAQFSTKVKSGKAGKQGRITGTQPRIIATPFQPSEASPQAVAIQTAKALDRDFKAARDAKAHADMKAAIGRHTGAITKLPAGKKPRK